MRRSLTALFGLALMASVVPAAPSHAQASGDVRIVFAKAGLVVGTGGGRGVLTFRGRNYRFRVIGLSLGVTIGASAMRLTGTASNLRDVRDFEGVYDAVGAGGALVGGAGAVRLTNAKGVTIALSGPRAGLEFAANRTGITISLQ
jgi:hypothetical protein